MLFKCCRVTVEINMSCHSLSSNLDDADPTLSSEPLNLQLSFAIFPIK